MLSVTFLHQVCPNLSSELSAPLQTLPYAFSECQSGFLKVIHMEGMETSLNDERPNWRMSSF